MAAPGAAAAGGDCGRTEDDPRGGSTAALALVSSLEEKMSALEAQGPGVLRVRRHCAAAGVGSALLKWVPPDYYDRPMSERAVRENMRGCGVWASFF